MPAPFLGEWEKVEGGEGPLGRAMRRGPKPAVGFAG